VICFLYIACPYSIVRIYNRNHTTQTVWDEASWSLNDMCFVSDNNSTEHRIEYFGNTITLDEAVALGLVSNYQTGTFNVSSDGSVVVSGCDDPNEVPPPVLTVELILNTRQVSIEVSYGLNSNFNQLRGWSDGINSSVIWEGTDDKYSVVYEVPDGVSFMRFTARSWSPAGVQSELASVEVTMADIAYCNGEPVTVDLNIGQAPTSGDDVILGTAGDDVIRGRGGDDTICGMGGDDFILGNSGDDWIDGGEGVDNIRGGAGNDVIYSGPGATVNSTFRVSGGNGNDTIYGGLHADDLRGGRGDDTIYGEGGNDQLRGARGDDMLLGGSGDDFLSGGGDVDSCDGGSGATDVATRSCESAVNVR